MIDDDSRGGETAAPDYLLESASLLSKKWHPAIVRSLSVGDGLGFSDLESRLSDISAKVLTDALEDLREHEIVDRTEVSQEPLRVEYTLTERGRELETVIQSLADWGETYLASEPEERVVLVAEDNREIAEMHTVWLEDEYTVRTAYDGEQALRKLDTDVDVVVLDRRMPGLSGDEVLDWIRSQGYDCRAVMVTSRDPAADILDLGFDEYVSKPVLKDALRDVVDDLIERATYDRETREYLAIRSKLAVLAAETDREALADSEEYAALRDRFETLRERVDDGDIDTAAIERMEVELLQ